VKPAFAGSPTSLAAGSCGFVRSVPESFPPTAKRDRQHEHRIALKEQLDESALLRDPIE
jgi:hypothetical protein